MAKSEGLQNHAESKNSWVPQSARRALKWTVGAGLVVGGLALIIAAA